MRKLFYLCGSAALTVLAFASCERNLLEADETLVHTVTIDASCDEADTKTALKEGSGKASYVWSSNDAQRLIVKENGVAGTDVTLTLSNENKNGTISATFSNSSADSYVYSAILAKNTLSASSDYPVIPLVQKTSSGTYDPDADVLVATSKSFSEPQESLNLRFERKAVINKMEIRGLPEDYYEYFIIKGDKKLRGYYNIDQEYWVGQDVNITVKLPTAIKLTPQSLMTVFFVSMPVSGVKLTVSGVTQDKKIYSKTATKTVDIKQGFLTYMKMNMSESTPPADYSGDYLLTNNSVSRMAKGRTWTLNDRYIQAIDVTSDGDYIYYNTNDLSDESLAKFTLARIEDAESPYFGMYTISNGGWYIHKRRTESPTDPGEGLEGTSGFMALGGQTYWSVSCSNGNWTIQADKSDYPSRSYFGYQPGNHGGCFYAHDQLQINVKLHDVSKLKPKPAGN